MVMIEHDDPRERLHVIDGGKNDTDDRITEIVPLKKRYRPSMKAVHFPLKYQGMDGSILWPNMKKDWSGQMVPKASCMNTLLAVMALGVECSYDVFHDKHIIAGDIIKKWAGEVSPHLCQMLRVKINENYDFDPGNENINDALLQLCAQNYTDPVCEYIDNLQWDHVPRLDRWLTTYMGADDTDFVRQSGRLVLIAAVRRARYPGTKFDQILTLEGLEGKGKSKAIEILAGKDNFSDQTILGLRDREQLECVQGVWLYEIADLGGMTKAEIESTKAFASRVENRARPAYGRHKIRQQRRCIFIATTNDNGYLRSQTGNRRFWPVKTGRVDIDAIARDRDQLWAEAAHLEAKGASIVLPEHLWAAARVEQDARREVDPWEDILAGIAPEEVTRDGLQRVSTKWIYSHLDIPAEKQSTATSRRIANSMRNLGWENKKIRIGQNTVWGYQRSDIVAAVPEQGSRREWQKR